MKKLYSLLAVGAIAGGITAQTSQLDLPLKTKHITNSKVAPKTINNPSQAVSVKATYFSEDFDGATFPPTGWTVFSGTSSTVTDPTQEWHSNANGNPGNCASVLYVNSVDTHDEWIATPAIDLSTGTSAFVRLNFEFNTSQFWHGGSPNDNADIWVKVSTDGGTTYTDTIFVEDDAALLTAALVDPNWETYVWTTARVDISSYVGQSNLVFAWHYEGLDGAQYNLDNISITDIEPNDLSVNQIFMSNPSNDFGYTMLPTAQTRPMEFGLRIQNIGSANQPNTQFTYDVNDGASSVASGTSSSSIALAPAAEDSVFETTSYTPSTNGTYTYTLTAEDAGNTDADPSNNVMMKSLMVNDFIWARDDNTFDGFINNIADANGDGFKIGHRFLATADQMFYAIDIGIADDASHNGQLFFGELYRFDAGTGDYVFVDNTEEVLLDNSIHGGNIITLPLINGATQINTGDELLVVAGHYGGAVDASDHVRFATSGNVVQGTVLGFDGAGALFNLTSPPAPVIRLNGDLSIGINEETKNTFLLGQNYPNPAMNETSITYSLVSTENVSLEVTDAQGRVIEVLNLGTQTAGEYTVSINTAAYNAGMYFYTLSNGTATATKTMTITK